MHVGLLGTMAQLYPFRPEGEDPARPVGARSRWQDPWRKGLWLPFVDGQSGERRINRRRSGSVRRANFPRVRRRQVAPSDRQDAKPGSTFPAPTAAMARHHHPRPGRSRNGNSEQCALHRPARMEQMLLHQGPDERASRVARPNPRANVGGSGGSGAAHRRRRALAGGQGSAGVEPMTRSRRMRAATP